jgi:quercetin dioxygenase-like cupin family protein
VQSWDLTQIEAPEGTRSPAVLETVDGARAIVIRIAPGQELGDHQVRERAWLTVVEGDTRIEVAGDVVEAGPGTLVTFEPGERHSTGSEHGPDHSDPLALARRGSPTPERPLDNPRPLVVLPANDA